MNINGLINRDYGWEIALFNKIRQFEDGLSIFEIIMNWDRYKGDHSPKFEFSVIILNVIIIEANISYPHHRDDEEDYSSVKLKQAQNVFPGTMTKEESNKIILEGYRETINIRQIQDQAFKDFMKQRDEYLASPNKNTKKCRDWKKMYRQLRDPDGLLIKWE